MRKIFVVYGTIPWMKMGLAVGYWLERRRSQNLHLRKTRERKGTEQLYHMVFIVREEMAREEDGK